MEQPKVGQEVVISGRCGGYEFGYIVTKVSPTGQITVEKGAEKIVFSRYGDERTSDKWFKRYLLLNVEKLKESMREQRNRAAVARSLRKVSDAADEAKDGWSKEALEAKIVELQTLLDAAKKAVDEI